MFDTWTAAQKRAAKKLFLWWAFHAAPQDNPTIQKWIALFDYLVVIWDGTAASLDPMRTGYPNETFVVEFWKSQPDETAFFTQVYVQLLMD